MNIINKQLSPAILFIVTLISSCSNNSQNDLVKINALYEGLKISNSLIHNQTVGVYESLEEKLASYGSKEKAMIWYPKAAIIKMYSDSIRKFIGGLKTGLANEKSEENAVELLFETNNKGNELYDKLIAYKKSILSVDPELEEVFRNNIVIITQSFDSINPGPQNFIKVFFHDTSKEMALSILSRFENNIHIAELETVTFCNVQVNNNYDGMKILSTLISQSTTHAKPGEMIEISAGVGSYSTSGDPHIKINGIAVSLSNGVANYRFKASPKPGKHSIQVTIDFINDDGRNMTTTKNIHYTTD